jgi:hypothetical protein
MRLILGDAVIAGLLVPSVASGQVNPEFGGRAKALTEARKYATVAGRLPRVLREAVQQVVIHKGKQPFGGGSTYVLIHTGQAAEYERDGYLEEAIVHEASHTAQGFKLAPVA